MKNYSSLTKLGFKVLENENFFDYTTLKIGGKADALVVIEKEEELVNVLKIIEREKIKFMIVASGSDLLVSDDGYDGLVIINKTKGISSIDKTTLEVKGGSLLQDLVDLGNKNGLQGFENLAGIPGSVGGAIYGNAGAYGQTISDKLTSVNVFKNGDIYRMGKVECEFAYRESLFKRNKNWVILSATFQLEVSDAFELVKKSKEIIELRNKKYPPGIKCPGSFFKNVIASEVSEEVVNKITADKIVYGKIPAGYLLEEVGAKGDKLGGIEIADYHGNLFMNKSQGKAADFYSLAKKYKQKVFEKFGINLEPEVQLIGFKEEL